MKERIEEIEERLNKATPKPWRADGNTFWHQGRSYDDKNDPHIYLGNVCCDNPILCKSCNANLDFIAHAPQDIEWLIKEVRRLGNEVEYWKETSENDSAPEKDRTLE